MDPAATLGYGAFFVVAGTALLYYGSGESVARPTDEGERCEHRSARVGEPTGRCGPHEQRRDEARVLPAEHVRANRWFVRPHPLTYGRPIRRGFHHSNTYPGVTRWTRPAGDSMTWHARTLDRLRPRLPVSPAAGVVLAGDLLAVFAFLGYGLYSHGLPPWEHPAHAAMTFAPFAIAWLVLSPVVGLYRRETLTSYRLTVALLVVGWPAISLAGGLLRSTSLFHGGASPVFLLVNVAFGLLVLFPWRLAATYCLRRFSRG